MNQPVREKGCTYYVIGLHKNYIKSLIRKLSKEHSVFVATIQNNKKHKVDSMFSFKKYIDKSTNQFHSKENI